MTAMDRPDRLPKFEEALRLALQEDAGTAQTDYLTDILVQTVASRQRPAWTYPSRWLPMSVITSRAAAVPRVPVRALIAVGLIALLIIGGLAFAGSRPKVPPPFGLAGDGLMAYSWTGDIRSVDLATGKQATIVAGTDVDHDPVWSRDGTHLAFVRDVSDTAQRLYVTRADGSMTTLVMPTAQPNIRDQAFSPDGREVLFTVGPDDARDLWTAETDGSGAHKVAGVHPLQPTWLPPGGAEIVFADQVPGGQPGGIYAVDPRSGAVRTILAPTPDVGRDALTVSPDGSKVAFSAATFGQQGNTYQVHIVGIEGSHETTLPSPPGATFQDVPTWSNDGERLAIIRGYAQHNEEMTIAIVNADGSGNPLGVETARGLTGCCDNRLAWSPADDVVILRPEDLNGNFTGQVLIDPTTGQTRPAPGGATTDPAQQRLLP
jgi:dipeptidyl aminopeptidase/acylaminoacyl peptidase